VRAAGVNRSAAAIDRGERARRGRMAQIAAPGDILDYWFADAARDPVKAEQRLDFWFRATSEHDREIEQRFGATLSAAAEGSLSDWKAGAHSARALVIVLDQFPRNIHRGTAAAFAHDEEALSAAKHGIGAGYLRGLTTIEQGFFVMPFQHCEDLTCQRESVTLFECIRDEATPAWRALAENMLQYARLHLELFERFGRFPHRNALLGRASTPDEAKFLESSTDSFGQVPRRT
jgi:uncharacterized protein (DUF924 family)